MATGTAMFLLPNQLSSGGFSGIATIIYYFLKIPMGTTIISLNIPLFLFALYKLGKKNISKEEMISIAIIASISMTGILVVNNKKVQDLELVRSNRYYVNINKLYDVWKKYRLKQEKKKKKKECKYVDELIHTNNDNYMDLSIRIKE